MRALAARILQKTSAGLAFEPQKRPFRSYLWSLVVGKEELSTGNSVSIRTKGDLKGADTLQGRLCTNAVK